MKLYIFGFTTAIIAFLLLGLVWSDLFTEARLNFAYVALVDSMIYPDEDNAKLIDIVQTQFNTASDNLEAQVGLGLLAQSLGESELAVSHLQKAVAMAPDNPVVAYHLGMAWKVEGKHARTLEIWRRGHVELRFTSEGEFHLDDDELLIARDKYRYALEINPTWEPAQVGLSKVLHKLYWRYQKNNPEQAILFIEEVIAVSPEPRDYIILGDYARGNDDNEGAKSRYMQGLEIFPGNATLNQRLGKLAFREGKMADAETFLMRALTLDPELADAYQMLGVILYRKGELDSAEKAFQENLRLNPDAAWGYARLGDVYVAQGRIENARMLYQRALELIPEMEYARRQLQALSPD